MLKNESYIGTFTYGKRRWMKAPGTNKRRARAADPSELVRQERPELAIVDRATWDAVQERREAVRAHYAGARDGKVRSNPGRRTQYLFSGLLYCNACGGPMVIAGGSACMYYRCSTALKRKTCSNTLSVKEPVVRESILEELRHRLASDEGIAYARKRIVQRLAEMDHQRAAKIREQQKKLATLESEVNRLADAVVSGVRSPTILARLADAERALESAKHDLHQLEAYRATPIRLPSPDEILDLAFQLDDRLTADVTRGRELLRRLFKDGRISLIPQPGGYYLARSEILPLVLLTKTPPDSSSEGVQFPPVSCAGRI